MSKYCFIGAPGVGKGTFATLICKKLAFKHLSLGDIIRKELNNKSKLGLEIERFVNTGRLIPTNLACKIIREEINKCDTGMIIDGFPRNVEQAEYLESCVPDIIPVYIHLDRNVAIQKLLGRRICAGCGQNFNVADVNHNGHMMPAILPDPNTCPLGNEKCSSSRDLICRGDDTEETIARRFDAFDTETGPVVDYYRTKSRLKQFDVKKGVDDVDELVAVMMSKHS